MLVRLSKKTPWPDRGNPVREGICALRLMLNTGGRDLVHDRGNEPLPLVMP